MCVSLMTSAVDALRIVVEHESDFPGRAVQCGGQASDNVRPRNHAIGFDFADVVFAEVGRAGEIELSEPFLFAAILKQVHVDTPFGVRDDPIFEGASERSRTSELQKLKSVQSARCQLSVL
jgi:hypothetical protein